MTIMVNQYVARDFLTTTRAIRDIGQESFVWSLDEGAPHDKIIDGKESTSKAKAKRMAQPLPQGEHYSQYDVPKDSEFAGIQCTDHVRWLSTREAVKRHIMCRLINMRTGEPYDPT